MQYSEHSTEYKLILGCKKWDSTAQKYLYKRYYGKMMSICMRYTKDKAQAQEILNDAFLKVFENIKKFRGEGSFTSWMRSIVFHTAIDAIRGSKIYKKHIDLDLKEEYEIDSNVLVDLSAEELMAYIQKLSPASRNVFSLHFIEGYRHHEIAKLLNIPLGTSKWHLANAKKELQQMLTITGEYLIAL